MKIKRVKLGESNATEYTYDNGEVWTIVDNPLFDGSVVAEGPKQTVKWEIFDLGADTPRILDSDKLIEMYKEAKKEPVIFGEDKPIPKLSQFNIPYFNGLGIFLEDYGFKPTRLPWRYESDRYSIIQAVDSDGNEVVNPTIYMISITSTDETVYRGRLFNSTHAAYIFGMVIENRMNTGKQDFPKLPIEPVKFEVTKTSFFHPTREDVQEIPAALIEGKEVSYADGTTRTEYRATKYFHTAQELLDYSKLVEKDLIIDRNVNFFNDTLGEPRLEIYDDYRE